ncbi:MAG: putative DNA base hypermodification protein [Actinomycetota bacterium]|nr:putative DNA base hypermodification protein [Actinomycetota bacterium]
MVVRAYWKLAAERQRIYFQRLEDRPPPWTSDPVLSAYKFCNAYRASDRVSQYLIREVIYRDGDYSAEDQILRIVLFRLFSKPATWELLEEACGDIRCSTFDVERYGHVLDRAFGAGERLYTGAFILCANRTFGHDRKHRNHLALIDLMLKPNGLAAEVARATSLGDIFASLSAYPLVGPFMAYQLAIDINYGELCDFSENEDPVAGPGARRGIAKCFSDTAGWDDRRIIEWMTAQQSEEFDRLGVEFPSLWGRPLMAIDIQNLFCELDKYARVAFPELRSERSRIKSRFAPTGPLPPPYFPPKWELSQPTQIAARRGA